MDMHSGGSRKESFSHCYIEAPETEAKVIFYNRFGHNPTRVTCTCCGEDYSISEHESLEQASGFERNCAYDNDKHCYIEKHNGHEWSGEYVLLETYKRRQNVCIIYASDIKPEEREGDVPEQGYIWKD